MGIVYEVGGKPQSASRYRRRPTVLAWVASVAKSKEGYLPPLLALYLAASGSITALNCAPTKNVEAVEAVWPASRLLLRFASDRLV